MQIWPPVVSDPATLSRQVWNVDTARTIPGVGRALQIYTGLITQAPLDQYRRGELLERPPLLELPDPALRSLATFVQVHVEDYLLHGNAVHLITARNADETVRSTRWFPAHMWSIVDPTATRDGGVDYYLNGTRVPRDDVTHVQRGAAEWAPWRGVGVVEQHLRTLNRAGLEEAAESSNLSGGGVPSVAVIAPQPELSQESADSAKQSWMAKYSGPGREPAILPNGTKVIPLSWSPVDAQLQEARKLTLTDIANIFNLDAYWLGGEAPSLTYRSPGPLFTSLIRISLGPVMTAFEQVWSRSWLPVLARQVRFDRMAMSRDDFGTEVQTGSTATSAGLLTVEEWRVRMGLPAVPELGELKDTTQPTPAAGPPQLQVVPDADDDEEATS